MDEGQKDNILQFCSKNDTICSPDKIKDVLKLHDLMREFLNQCAALGNLNINGNMLLQSGQEVQIEIKVIKDVSGSIYA